MAQEKQVFVLLDVLNFAQCMREVTRILTTECIDGIILTNIFFGSEISLHGEYPNLLHLSELIKHRHPKKSVGIEIYDIKDVDKLESTIQKSKEIKLDMLWCRNGNTIVDILNPEDIIVSNQDYGTPPELEQVIAIKNSLLVSQKLVLTSGYSTENVEPYVPYSDKFIVNGSVRSENDTDLEHCPKKMKTFCQKVKTPTPSFVAATN